MILVELDKVLEVFGDIHPLDHNANAYKSKIERLVCYNLPKAKWKNIEPPREKTFYIDSVYCTNCKTHEPVHYKEYRWCPTCGATMEGEE